MSDTTHISLKFKATVTIGFLIYIMFSTVATQITDDFTMVQTGMDSLVEGDTLIPIGDLEPYGGLCNGIVRLDLIDPFDITGHKYKITFRDNVILSVESDDTIRGLGFTLLDTDEKDTLFFNQAIPDSGEDLPVTDGFRLFLQHSPPGVISLEWTKVAGDTCTFDWRYQSIDSSLGAMLIQEDVSSYDNWKITVDYSSIDYINWIDIFSNEEQTETQLVPIHIEVITDTLNPRDVTTQSWLADFNIQAPWEDYREYYYSLLGWDLIPGGAGYTEGSPGWYEKYVDILILKSIETNPTTGDTIPNYMYLFTNNKPDTSYNYFNEQEVIDAKAPSDGDEFTIITLKTFRPEVWYEFETKTNVSVVPDVNNGVPLVFTLHQNHPNPFNPVTTIRFDLPETGEVKLVIYDILGQEVARLVNERIEAGKHSVIWDAGNLSSGIYFYQIVAGQKGILKYKGSRKLVVLK